MDNRINLTNPDNKYEIVAFDTSIEFIEHDEDKVINILNLTLKEKDLITLERAIHQHNKMNNPYYEKYKNNIIEYKEDRISQLHKEINELRRKNSELKGVIKQLSD